MLSHNNLSTWVQAEFPNRATEMHTNVMSKPSGGPNSPLSFPLCFPLTQVLLFILRLPKNSPQKQFDVVNDDEGRGKGRPTVIFHNQVVTLKFPEDICISLHNLKSVT